MFCLEHQCGIQQVGFFSGEFFIGTQGAQHVFCGVHALLGEVQIQTLVVEEMLLGLEGVAHNGGETGDEQDATFHQRFQLGVVRVVVVRIESQHATAQLIHDVGAGGL